MSGRRLVAAAIVAGMPLLAGMQARHARAVDVVRDVAYRVEGAEPSARHRIDFYVPPGQGWPLAVVLHGGDWRTGNRVTAPGARYDNIARALAERGIAVALAGYRLSDGGPEGTAHPGHVADAAAAVAFARAWLVARGTRPAATHLVGHEAGAHLAALLATNPRFLEAEGLSAASLRGVIGLSGTYRVDPIGAADADVFGVDPSMRLDASPYHQAAEPGRLPGPSFLLLVAESERPGLEDEARGFRQRVASGGGAAVVEAMPRDHDALVDRIGLPGDRTTERIVAAILDRRVPTSTATPTATSRPSATATAAPTPTPTPADAQPPGPPASGPGGASRPFAALRRAEASGPGGWEAWWPDAPEPPAPWPVVAFMPDAVGRAEPEYGAWIEHTARGGAVVVAPADLRRPEVAAAGIEGALRHLAGEGVAVDSGWRAYVGHGAGADAAVFLAAGWFPLGLPAPRALLAVAPRRAPGAGWPLLPGRLPGDAMAVLVTLGAAERDPWAEHRAWRAMLGLPGRQRAHLELVDDRHGMPALVADATAPLTAGAGVLDALDWRGIWRWLDALVACRREGRWCAHVLEDPLVQVDLGRWSDGRPVGAARLGAGPPPAPAVALPSLRR